LGIHHAAQRAGHDVAEPEFRIDEVAAGKQIAVDAQGDQKIILAEEPAPLVIGRRSVFSAGMSGA